MLRLTVPLLLLAFVSACPPATECTSLLDCGLGEICDLNGTCIPDDGRPPGGEGEGEGEGDPGEGEGEGEGELINEIDAFGDPFMLIRDPRNANLALLGENDPGNGGFDQLRSLDLASGALEDTAEFDFNDLADGCGIDNVLLLAESELGASVLPEGDELWLTCRDASDVTVQYPGGNLADSFETNLPLAAIARIVVADAIDNAGPQARVVLADRGGTTLTIVSIEDTDAARTARDLEPVAGASFTAITAVFVVDNTGFANDIGDVIMVFDRRDNSAGSPPRLVPLRRSPDTLAWSAPPYVDTNLDILTLPADTHAVIFREGVGIADLSDLDNIDNAQLEIPNVVAVRPLAGNAGLVSFFRYEADRVNVQTDFIDLELNANNTLPAALPPATDRVLFEEVGAAPFFFYAMSNAPIAFRFPLHTGTDDLSGDVLEAEFNDASGDRPNGMVPILGADPTTAWFSLSSERRLYRLTFNQ